MNIMNKNTAFKFVFLIILFIFISLKIDIKKSIEIITNSNLWLLLLSILLVFPLYSIRTLKWNVFLRAVNVKLPFFSLYEIILKGTFFGMFTPARFGELTRAHYIKEEKAIVIPTVIWDRITDIILLLTLSLAITQYLFFDINLIYILFSIVIFFSVFILFILNKRVIRTIISILGKKKDMSDLVIKTNNIIWNDKKILIKGLLLGLIYYIINITVAVLVIKAINPDLSPLIALILPILIIIGNIPLTISGLGLREYAAIICFSKLGEDTTVGLSFSILVFIITTFIPALVGYIFIFIEKDQEK